MLKFSLYVIVFLVLTNFKQSVCSLTINGSVAIHSLIFEKIINAFDYVLVKFDEPFAYGEKEDVYKEVAKVSINIPNLLMATVGIADYGDKENSDLSERYSITKANYPAYRLFHKDINKPIAYQGDVKADSIKSFIVKHTGAYMGLEGCLEEFDKMAKGFVMADENGRNNILELMSKKVKELKSNKDIFSSAEKYLKIAKKIHEIGQKFVVNEQERLQKLTDGNVSDNKKIEIKLRLNILQSFELREVDGKLEL